MLLSLVVFAAALAFALALMPVYMLFAGQRVRLRVIGRAVLCGYLLGSTVAWFLVPSVWTLSFPQTLAAAVDADTWGHPVEHYAESVLVMMMAVGLVVSALSGSAAGLWLRFSSRGHAAV
jgi:hypothetical protein